MKISVDLSGKKILLFVPEGSKGRYGSKILEELQNRNAIVSIYPERPSSSTFFKIIFRLFKKRVPAFFSSYISKVINENNSVQFDFLLVVRGELFTPQSVQLLRKAFPKTFFILYCWDILAANDVRSIIPCFDRVFSFDPEDVKFHNRMIFRPLFYLDRYKNITHNNKRTIDVFFAGTMHTVRLRILKQVERYLIKSNRTYYFYFYLPGKIVYLKNLIEGNFPVTTKVNDFHYKLLSDKELCNYISVSNTMIDICSPKQHSLSMRTMEALGSNTKLITNCQDIANYDFYNSNNILIIDEKDLVIPDSFFESPYIRIPEDVYNKYSLSAWIDDIFDSEYKQTFIQTFTG